MKNFYIILILFLSFTIYSCAKKSDSSSSSSTTELEGTWVVSCFDDGGGNYLIKTRTVTGTDVVSTIEVHTDSSCTTDKDKWENSYVSLSIGQEMTFDTYGSSGGSGHQFTMNLSTRTYTPQLSSVVSWANTNSWCGESDWELNTPQDVAGMTCSSTTYPSSGHSYYGLYILDGDKFMSNASSSSYPDSVNSATSNIYVKQ